MTKNLPGPQPYLLTFEHIGDAATGRLITTQHAENLPFAVKRVFWVRDTPVQSQRGGHANKLTQEIMVAVNGSVKVETESVTGQKAVFELDNPMQGLYIPAYCWLTIQFSPDAILVCLTSTDYDETDYIEDLETFRRYQQP